MSATRLTAGSLHRGGRSQRPHRDLIRDVATGPVAIILLALMLWKVLNGPASAFDFRYAYRTAGHLVLVGRSPYAWTDAQFRLGAAFVYPALSGLVFAPISLLPVSFGTVLFTIVSLGLVPLTLWVLGVRDWRVFGITLIWVPVYDGWMTANESLFLMFGLAGLWRWRDRRLLAGLLTAALISLKPMMWPLELWLIVTRRWRASITGIIAGAAVNAAAWSVLGFDQIGAFLHASKIDVTAQWRYGYGIPALLGHFGAGRAAGIATIVIVSTLLIAVVLRTRVARGCEVQALTLAVASALVSSPLVWSHYLVLMIVPLAVLRPRVDWVWALPLLMWVCPPAYSVHAWQAIVFWIAAATMFVVLARSTAPGLKQGQP